MSQERPTLDLLLEAVARRLVASEAIGTAPPDAVLTAVAEAAVTIIDSQAASIAIHDPVTDRLVFAAAAGPSAGAVVGLSIQTDVGIAGYAFTTGQPLAVADVSTDPRFDRTVAEATGYVPNTLLATPLMDATGTVGVLEVLDRRGGTFTLRDLDTAAALANAATVTVRAARGGRDASALLRRSLAELSDEVAAGLDGTAIDALVERATADLSDDDDPTWRQAERIARLREVDPDSVELAIDWLDALLRRTDRQTRGGSSGRAP
ncbi:MAG: GAF domain-containing protein [Candidatus Limnocylindrales bacterium]